MESFNFESSKLHANFSKFEQKIFDRLKVEYLALLDGKEYKYYEDKRDLRRQGELNKKMNQINDFYSNPQKRKEMFPLEIAREIMGEDFMGPEQVKKAFGIELYDSEIPKIPFSFEDLERAKELGQFLVLRVNEAPNGEPLTMLKMHELLKNDFAKHGKGKVLYNATDDWKMGSEFFTTETPQVAWALVSKTPIPGSKGKNYLEQTQALADYITKDIFRGQILSQQYQVAIDEFQTYYQQNFKGITSERINFLLGGYGREAYAKGLATLHLNELARQTPVEALYDMLIYFQNTGNRLFENDEFVWTKHNLASGSFVGVGSFTDHGVRLDKWLPDRAGRLVVSFSHTI